MSVTTLEVHHRLDDVAEEWDQLADRVGSPPFGRPGWFAAWVAGFADGNALELFVLRREGALAAVLPMLAGGGRLRTPTNSHTPAFTVVAADDAAVADVLRRVLRLRRRAVTLGFVDPRTAEQVRVAARDARCAVRETLLLQTPTVNLAGASPLARLDPKARRVLARRRRRLEERGPLRLEVHDGGDRLEELTRTWFAMEASSWKGRQGDAVLSRSETVRFYVDLSRWAAARGHLLLVFLCLGGAPIAFQLALVDPSAWYFLKTGYDEELRALGPGKLLMAELLERAAELGRVRVDLGGSADPYKLEWTKEVRPYVELTAYPPTVTGRATHLVEVLGPRVAGAAQRGGRRLAIVVREGARAAARRNGRAA